MLNVLLIFHIILSCLIILFILLSKNKGSEIGIAFTNTNTDILNFKESNSLLKKIIVILSIMILLSTISINFLNKKNKNTSNEAIVKLIEK